jgi:hypothetical protein
MAITAKAGESRQLAPEGSYFGICIGVYDLGTQQSKQYEPSHKVLLEFELHKKKGPALDKDGRPLRVTQFYPLGFGKRKDGTKAKLRQAVEGILGRSFSDEEAKSGYDVTSLADVCCRLRITHNTSESGSKYEELTFAPLDEDDPEPKTESNIVVYELDPSREIPSDVSEWIAKMIRRSSEWVKVHGADREEAKPAARNGNGNAAKSDKGGRKAVEEEDLDDDQPF